jgi:hypothetical protein
MAATRSVPCNPSPPPAGPFLFRQPANRFPLDAENRRLYPIRRGEAKTGARAESGGSRFDLSRNKERWDESNLESKLDRSNVSRVREGGTLTCGSGKFAALAGRLSLAKAGGRSHFDPMPPREGIGIEPGIVVTARAEQGWLEPAGLSRPNRRRLRRLLQAAGLTIGSATLPRAPGSSPASPDASDPGETLLLGTSCDHAPIDHPDLRRTARSVE